MTVDNMDFYTEAFLWIANSFFLTALYDNTLSYT
jgi:hypothetical protein